jgi:hypothetical protein
MIRKELDFKGNTIGAGAEDDFTKRREIGRGSHCRGSLRHTTVNKGGYNV